MTKHDCSPQVAGPAAYLLPGEPPLARPEGEVASLFKSVGLLMVILVVCLPPMLVSLGESDSTHTMENIAVLSTQETWMRQHADPDAWLMPSRNGRPRVEKPPLLVWINLLALWDLQPGPGAASAQEVLYRCRLVSVAMALLLIAATFWAGLSIGDRRSAALAALILGTTWFVQRQGRTASYDIHVAAWVALALAGALWAMNPFRARPHISRCAAGWLIAAVALAAAWMTKGPLALAVTMLGLLAVIVVQPRRRMGHVLAMVAMIILAAALVLPWYWYAHQHVTTAAATWTKEFAAQRAEFQVPWYYLGLLGLIAPWSVWLCGSLTQPFMRASALERRRLLMAWLWFVVIFVFFSIPGAKQQRYILPIMPAAALLMGQFWRFHIDLAQHDKREPLIKLLTIPHWAGLLGVSVALGPVLLMQDWFVQQGWTERDIVGPIAWPTAVGGAVMLVLIALFGCQQHKRFKPMTAALATVLWALVISTILWHAYARSPARDDPLRAQAGRVMAAVDHQPLYALFVVGKTDDINEQFLLYSQRIVPRVAPDDLQSFTAGLEVTTFIIADHDEEFSASLKQSGWQSVIEFRQDKHRPNTLWRHEAYD